LSQINGRAGPVAKPKGVQALVGVAITMIGVLAAAYPTSAVLKAISDAAPQLASALPVMISACGSIVAALSDPPDLPKRRVKE
jgi:hypothetical protein